MDEGTGCARFAWQEGYFACSVSKSQLATIRQYVVNQKDHHGRMDFAKEFKLLAGKHGFEIGIEANQQVSFPGTPVPGSGFFRPFRDWLALKRGIDVRDSFPEC
jgi:hypothetical protein